MNDWTLWSEQPPTLADADERGLVECYVNGARWFCDWDFIPRLSIAYWRTPTSGPEAKMPPHPTWTPGPEAKMPPHPTCHSTDWVKPAPSCDCLEWLEEATAALHYKGDSCRPIRVFDLRGIVLAAIAAKKEEKP
ncbi:MAG: hypothetical protein KAY22_05645 [Rhizorhabdus sp.]|uniref:hypothetical protein n=1 Tax=Rhizorhabdus sp. TaxID=1968843 RepID=UPI001B79FC07|nr:hypothetical protein [Rhizorhabdus sp.]MBP8231769.1 hypothetical protein [Rhizorhabdus sp.]